MWKSPRPDEEIEEADPERLVRDTWRFETFEPLDATGPRRARPLRGAACQELEPPRDPAGSSRICDLNVAMMRFPLTRWLFWAIRPPTRQVPNEDWRQLGRVMRAHSRVRSRSQYTAIVWQKPR